MAQKIFKFHSDAGHGWVAVRIADLIALDLINKITPYSFMNGGTAYLEEDVDAGTFLNKYREVHGADSFKVVPLNQSAGTNHVRRFARYDASKIDVTMFLR